MKQKITSTLGITPMVLCKQKLLLRAKEAWVPSVLSSGWLEAVYSGNNDGRTDGLERITRITQSIF